MQVRHLGTGIPDPILFRPTITLFGTGRPVCAPLCRRLNIIGAPIEPTLVLGLVMLCWGVSE